MVIHAYFVKARSLSELRRLLKQKLYLNSASLAKTWGQKDNCALARFVFLRRESVLQRHSQTHGLRERADVDVRAPPAHDFVQMILY
jgi:hypothetical protein